MAPDPHRALRLVLIGKAVVGLVLLIGLGFGWHLRRSGLTLGEAATELRRGSEPRYEWRSVDGKHWQALVATAGEAPEVTTSREGNGAGCMAGMVRVKGNHRVELHGEATGEIERIQDAACTDWISRDFPARCRTFDGAKIAEEVKKLPTRPMDFCIDRFEYPNIRGENPMIVVTFHEAEALCKKSKKRLCNETEWTFACEGEEVAPYPYGMTRDATACVVDRSWRPFSENALSPRDGATARAELDRLWQAEPSGSRGACKSPFGVYDMTGNVDEWTRSVKTTGYSSVLKGGYWGPVRARCRPATRAHNEDFVAYQQSFRCCGDSDHAVAPPLRPKDGTLVLTPTSLPPPASTAAIGEAPRTSALEAEEAVDEIEAIAKAHLGISCGIERQASNGKTGAVFALLSLGLIWLRRRR